MGKEHGDPRRAGNSRFDSATPYWHHDDAMVNLTIEGIPDELHARIKRRADVNHRSMNREILQILEEAVDRAPQARPDSEEILRRLRALRAKVRGPGLSPEEIDRAIDEGRP